MLNLIIPIFIIIIIVSLLIRFHYSNKLFLLTPIVWFLLVSMAYIGFGPLIYEFGNQASIDYLQKFNNLNYSELLKTNLLNLVGLLITLIAYKIFPRINFSFLNSNLLKLRALNILLIFTIIFIIAYIMNFYSECLNSNYGQLFIKLYDVRFAILLIASYLIKRKISLINLSLLLIIAIILMLDVLSLSKLKIISSLIFIILGYFLKGLNYKYFIFGLISLIIIFPFLDRVIGKLRTHGYTGAVTCNTSLANTTIPTKIKEPATSIKEPATSEVINNALLDVIIGAQSKITYGWVRIVLAPNQSYIISLYDAGKAGNSLNLMFWMPLPRFMFSSKPIIHPLSNYKDDRIDLLLNSGFYAEGYWNNGWTGVIIVSVLLGAFLKFGTILALSIIKNKIYILYPVISSMILSSIRIEDWFTTNIYSSFIQSAFILIVVYLSIQMAKYRKI